MERTVAEVVPAVRGNKELLDQVRCAPPSEGLEGAWSAWKTHSQAAVFRPAAALLRAVHARVRGRSAGLGANRVQPLPARACAMRGA